MPPKAPHPLLRLAITVAAVSAATVLLRLTGLANHTTVALGYLLLVLVFATVWGLLEATAASILSTLCFNYFFLPPTGTFTIADPENWIALSAFLVVSIVASQISERARRKGREASAQFKSTLLDALAHELKTPLTSLKASASGLRTRPAADPQQGELLSIIEEETDRMDRLISEILRMARTDAGKLRLDRKNVAVAPFLARALEITKRRLSPRQFLLEAPAQLPEIAADEDLAATVLRCLLENADKYSTPGRPVHVSAEPLGTHVCIRVADQGPGLMENELSNVFERDYRAPSTQKLAAGSGLGLAIARDIVMAHGGKIWAESVPGEGCRFSFTLPQAR